MRESDTTWFADGEADFAVFRVNRRPIDSDELLWQRELPADVLDHFVRMLAPGYEIKTGRRHQRVWRVGGLKLDTDDRVLLGNLGWVPTGKEPQHVPSWSDEEQDWTQTATTQRGGRVLPFGFDADTRLLAVMAEKRTKASTLAQVFQRVLRENEEELPLEQQSTEWSVEPVLDAREFKAWLGSMDVVKSVSFRARLPNPEPRDAFRDLTDRMQARHATEFSERIASSRDEGLVNIEQDRDFQQAIAMGEQGFATLSGKGVSDGQNSTYRQTKSTATEHVEELPGTWGEVWTLMRDILKERIRRFREATEEDGA